MGRAHPGASSKVPARRCVRAGHAALGQVLATFAICCMTVIAQGDTNEQVELGHRLFDSKALSSTGKVSCATCHEPTKSFADAKPDAEGEMDIGIGRNSPTLFAIGKIPLFRDPAQSLTAKPGRPPKVMTLEERCLAPLENPLEMGPSVETTIKLLKKQQGMVEEFNRAFGGAGGITKDRLARALAAYLRTIEPPKTPYQEYLQGKRDALSPEALRGLEVFNTRGKCASCHGGDALSDGLMHVVDPPHGQRIQDRVRAASERKMELVRREFAALSAAVMVKQTIAELREEADKARNLPGGGGYDPEQLEVQTTTLWDVARTAPYFRDGSVTKLEDALKQHVFELREIEVRNDEVRKTLSTLDKAGKRSPTKLRPARAATEPKPVPDQLTQSDMKDLLAFLNALSPK